MGSKIIQNRSRFVSACTRKFVRFQIIQIWKFRKSQCGGRNSTKSDPIVYCFCHQTILNMLSFRFREKQLWTHSYSLHVWSTIYKIPTNVVISRRQYKCFSRAYIITYIINPTKFQSNHIVASWKNWNAFSQCFPRLKQSSWWKQSNE